LYRFGFAKQNSIAFSIPHFCVAIEKNQKHERKNIINAFKKYQNGKKDYHHHRVGSHHKRDKLCSGPGKYTEDSFREFLPVLPKGNNYYLSFLTKHFPKNQNQACMKKIILIAALMLSHAVAVFANEEKVSPAVENAFKNKFPGAANVEWLAGPSYYKVSFIYNGVQLFAIFSDDASLMGTARNITSSQLPYLLQKKVKRNLSHYWMTDLHEMSSDCGFSYYMTLEDADNKMILESKEGGDWKIISMTEN